MLELDDDFVFIDWWYCANYFMCRNSPRMTTPIEQTYSRYLRAEFKRQKEHSKFSQEKKTFLTVKTSIHLVCEAAVNLL